MHREPTHAFRSVCSSRAGVKSRTNARRFKERVATAGQQIWAMNDSPGNIVALASHAAGRLQSLPSSKRFRFVVRLATRGFSRCRGAASGYTADGSLRTCEGKQSAHSHGPNAFEASGAINDDAMRKPCDGPVQPMARSTGRYATGWARKTTTRRTPRRGPFH